MEKIKRALIGVEDNAAAIRALRAKAASDAEAANALRNSVNANAAAVAALRSNVADNADMIELLGMEVRDNTEAVADALSTRIANNAAAIAALDDKTNIIVIGVQDTTAASTVGTFGTYEFSGPSVVIMEGDGKTARELLCNRTAFAKGMFPIVFGVEKPSIVEFIVRPPGKNLHLILIGHVKKKE